MRNESTVEADPSAITQGLDRSALEVLVHRPRRHILVVEDTEYSGRLLASILGRWSFDVVTASGQDTAAEAIEGLDRVDLGVVALPGSSDSVAALMDALRALPALENTPVLAVTSPNGGAADYDELRKHGVVGVMSRDTSAEQLAFRVGQILPLGSVAERRHVRVPVDFVVEIDSNGERTEQRAENLSMGGIRLRSTVAFEVNATVKLCFHLPLHPGEAVAVEARVIHCEPVINREGTYTVGLFFRTIPARGRTLVEVEIVRLLTSPVAISA